MQRNLKNSLNLPPANNQNMTIFRVGICQFHRIPNIYLVTLFMFMMRNYTHSKFWSAYFAPWPLAFRLEQMLLTRQNLIQSRISTTKNNGLFRYFYKKIIKLNWVCNLMLLHSVQWKSFSGVPLSNLEITNRKPEQ